CSRIPTNLVVGALLARHRRWLIVQDAHLRLVAPLMMALMRAARSPRMVALVQDLMAESQTNGSRRKAMTRLYLQSMSLVLVTSRCLADEVVRLGIPREQVRVVYPSACWLTSSAPPAQRQVMDRVVILNVANYRACKGQDVMIRALAQMRCQHVSV